MSEAQSEPAFGQAAWLDLTVPDSEQIRDFYTKVVGFETSTVDMGGYQDYCLHPPGQDAPVAGVCRTAGANADQPGGWIPYFTVADLDESLAQVEALGGKALAAVRTMGKDRFCPVQDPSGAVCALYQKG
ncbi:VOC domain-containing protein [Acanthopleuribacter pedis]